MIRPEDRAERRRKHEAWDPDEELQRRGYAYLTDENGLRLARLDLRRGWRAWLRGEALPYGVWVRGKLRREARKLASRQARTAKRASDAPLGFGPGRTRTRARLRALETENAELRRLLAGARRREVSWARAARRIEGSRTWRAGNVFVRALRRG